MYDVGDGGVDLTVQSQQTQVTQVNFSGGLCACVCVCVHVCVCVWGGGGGGGGGGEGGHCFAIGLLKRQFTLTRHTANW